MAGNALSNMTIAGLNVGSAFSYLGGASLFSAIGTGSGYLLGSFVGSALGNELMINLFGYNPSTQENVSEGVAGWIMDGLMKFLENFLGGNMKKIVASLKYGRIHRKSLIFLWIMFALGLFLGIYSFVFLFSAERSLVGFICGFLSGNLFLGTALYIIIKNYINCKNCKKWMQDAVELNATSVGIKKTYFGFSDIGLRRLKVSFKYNKKKYVKYSGTKQTNGYDRAFLRYSDAQITILFSPQFDEVMILDDKT